MHRLPEVSARLLEELLVRADADDTDDADDAADNSAAVNDSAAANDNPDNANNADIVDTRDRPTTHSAAATAAAETLLDDGGRIGASSSNGGGGDGTGGSGSAGRAKPRPVEAEVRKTERGPLLALLPPGLPGGAGGSSLATGRQLSVPEPISGGAEAAICAEYALRCGGSGRQQHRAHVVAAPCFLRVSSAIAYPY